MKEEDFDFGFSFDDQNSLEETNQSLQKTAETLTATEQSLKKQKEISRNLMKEFTKFLNKLKANPEKTTIVWPKREEEITKFLAKLNEIYKPNE